MFYPSSQIKTGLYTNGNEYIIFKTKEDYIGYFYELSNGKKYTGKSPQDGSNNLITLKKTYLNLDLEYNEGEGQTYEGNPIVSTTPYNSIPPTVRYLPLYNPNTPTQKDYDLGAFQRYFCKKNNELIYLEVDKKTYNLFQMQSPTVAWDLYSPLYTMWYIKGNKEQTYKTNKNLISLIEQKEKWYGFSQYFKEDYLKYYLES